MIDENPYRDRVLLYSSPILVRRPKGDLEDHSLLIEIESDKEYSSLQSGVYYAQETIYLDPSRVRFIFDCEEHRRATLSMSQGSLETKLVHLYRNDIEPYSQVIDSVSGLPDLEEKHASDFAGEIDKDRRVNKLKGMLYGFYIGAMLSPRMRYVDLRRCLRKLWNSCSVVLSQGRLASKDEAIVSEGLDKYKLSLFKLEFENASSYRDKQELDAKIEGMYSIPRLRQDVEDGGEKVAQWFEKQRVYLAHRVQSEMRTLSIAEESIVADKDGLIKLSTGKELPCFIKEWFNDILLRSEYNRKLSTYKDELLVALLNRSKVAVNVYGDWENSFERTHLNQMRRIANGEAQPQFDWSVNYTASLLAVAARSDDWQKVIEYLEDVRHNDYRLAFAYYGVLYGFADLPRDFTDVLFTCEDKGYVANLYCELFGQLHGEVINPEVLAACLSKASVEAANDIIQSEMGSQEELSLSVESITDEELRNRIYEVLPSVLKGLKKQEEKKTELEKALASFTGDDTSKFLLHLCCYEGWSKTDASWKRMQERLLGITSNSIIPSASPVVGADMLIGKGLPFQGELNFSPEKSMLDDRSWWEETARLISDEEARRQYLIDVEWFVGNHSDVYKDEKKGRVEGYYRDKDKSNSRVLGRLEHYLNNKRTRRTKWLSAYYSRVPIQDIVDLLREKYGK